MEYENSVNGITPEAMESLRLPAAFDKAALDIDTFLSQDERPVSTLGFHIGYQSSGTSRSGANTPL